jgi:arginine/serine-rich splicing factor 12
VLDHSKLEEIMRTRYVGNLDSKTRAEEVLKFFEVCGTVTYLRMAGDDSQPTRFAFIEFETQAAADIALQKNGAIFKDRPIKVCPSNHPIVKPAKSKAVERREIQQALKGIQALDAQFSKIFGAEPKEKEIPKRNISRSRSRSRRRSRDKEKDRDRHSIRKRSRTRSRDRKSKKNERGRDKERRRERERTRSSEKSKKKREREREKDSKRERKRRHSTSKDRSHEKSRVKYSRSVQAEEEKNTNKKEETGALENSAK